MTLINIVIRDQILTGDSGIVFPSWLSLPHSLEVCTTMYSISYQVSASHTKFTTTWYALIHSLCRRSLNTGHGKVCPGWNTVLPLLWFRGFLPYPTLIIGNYSVSTGEWWGGGTSIQLGFWLSYELYTTELDVRLQVWLKVCWYGSAVWNFCIHLITPRTLHFILLAVIKFFCRLEGRGRRFGVGVSFCGLREIGRDNGSVTGHDHRLQKFSD